MYKIIEDNIEYHINVYGVLMDMVNKGKRREVSIPHRFPSGKTIDAINSHFCRGKYSKIIISDDIPSIGCAAFEDADVSDEIVWPSSCKTILEYTFSACTAKRVSNIDNVTKINKEAFRSSGFEEIVWPSKCRIIPEGCFTNSSLKSITNIDNVSEVGEWAFSYSDIEKIVWPKHCIAIPKCCFCKCQSLTDFTVPETLEQIDSCAFEFADFVNPLDLSNLYMLSMEGNAFTGVDREKVIFPYYLPEESIEIAFCEEG